MNEPVAIELDLNFQKSFYPRSAFSYKHHMSTLGISRVQAKTVVRKIKEDQVVRSSSHQVAINAFSAPAPFGPGTWLSIKRVDKEIIVNREDLALIMRRLLPGYCGFELFPAPSRLVDTANQFHIWAFPSNALESFAGVPLGELLSLNENVSIRYLEFPGAPEGCIVAVLLQGLQDWRAIYKFKEFLYPGHEAAIFWGPTAGHPFEKTLLCLTQPGLVFPFGFRTRNVLDSNEAAKVPGARQRGFI